MHRRPRALVLLLAIGLASSLLLASCSDPGVQAEGVSAAPDLRVSQAVERADPPTTTTTTAPPPTTTTTTAPPPTTAAPKAPAPTSPVTTNKATAAVAPPPAPASPSSCTTAGLLASINRERGSQGLPGLALRGGATSVACGWSRHMTTAGLGHNGNLSGDLAANGVTGWRSIGENVGYAGSASAVFNLFMGSSGHRDNILKASFTQVGIGVVTSGSRVWVTFDFVGY